MLRTIALLMMISGILLSGMAHANTTGGTISFTGRIVQSPCGFSVQGRSLETTCTPENETLQSVKSLDSLAVKDGVLPKGTGTISMQWIDKQDGAGIVTIVYR